MKKKIKCMAVLIIGLILFSQLLYGAAFEKGYIDKTSGLTVKFKMKNVDKFTIANDSLYILNNKGLFAYDLNTGEQKWEIKFSVMTKFPSGPVILDDLIFYGTYYDTGSIHSSYTICHALDINTGIEKWQFKAKQDNSEGIFVQRTGVYATNNVVYFSSKDLYALDCQTGQEKWVFKAKDEISYVEEVPRVINEGMLTFSEITQDSGDLNNMQKLIPELRFTIHSIESLTGLEIKTPVKVMNTLRRITSGAIFYQKHTFTKYYLVGQSITSPEQSWEIEINGEIVAMVVFDSTIYYMTKDSYLRALDCKNINEIWRLKMDSEIIAMTVFDSTIYYTTEDGYLHALDRKNPNEIWRLKIGGRISIHKLDGNTLYCGNTNNLFAINIDTGELKWKFKISKPNSTMVYNNTLYVRDDNKNLYALQLEN